MRPAGAIVKGTVRMKSLYACVVTDSFLGSGVYSALACFRMGISASASFQGAKKPWYSDSRFSPSQRQRSCAQ
jgi:hypothetical protein